MAATDEDHRGLLRLAALHVLESFGIERVERGALDFCVDYIERYLISIGRKSRGRAEVYGRAWSQGEDIRLVLQSAMPCGPRSSKDMEDAIQRFSLHWTGEDTYKTSSGAVLAGDKHSRAVYRQAYARILASATRDAPRHITGAPVIKATGSSISSRPSAAAELVEIETNFAETPTYYPPHLPPMPLSHSYAATRAEAPAWHPSHSALASYPTREGVAHRASQQSARLAILENASSQGARTLSSLWDFIRQEESARLRGLVQTAGEEVLHEGNARSTAASVEIESVDAIRGAYKKGRVDSGAGRDTNADVVAVPASRDGGDEHTHVNPFLQELGQYRRRIGLGSSA